jgi:ABC-type polysaccharide/polyol phosphate export permease
VLEQANLIKKMVFPSEILSIVQLAAALINHLIAIGILIGFFLVTGDRISWKIFMTLPYLLLLSLFTTGISWILSSLNVYLRDIGQLIGVVVNIWFFLTPIIYPRHLIPDSLHGLFVFNPMLHIVDGYRMALLGEAEIDVIGLLYLMLVSLSIFTIGGLTFKKLKPAFADVL